MESVTVACLTCGTEVPPGVARCPVCHSLVLPDESKRLGLSPAGGRVRWEARRRPADAGAKRALVALVVLLALTNVLVDVFSDSGRGWAAAATLGAGFLGLLLIARRTRGGRS